MDCEFGGTIFIDINLSKVVNLNDCFHCGGSTLDHLTLQMSGKLPLEFLRGVGFSDVFINEYPNLFFDQAIQFYCCFISYSSKDDEFAKRLHSDLQDNGIRCWFAPEDLKIGDKIAPAIEKAIKIYDKLILIISKNSINSDWVKDEIESAIEKENRSKRSVLFPISIDKSAFSLVEHLFKKVKREIHFGNFIDWKNHDSYKKNI